MLTDHRGFGAHRIETMFIEDVREKALYGVHDPHAELGMTAFIPGPGSCRGLTSHPPIAQSRGHVPLRPTRPRGREGRYVGQVASTVTRPVPAVIVRACGPSESDAVTRVNGVLKRLRDQARLQYIWLSNIREMSKRVEIISHGSEVSCVITLPRWSPRSHWADCQDDHHGRRHRAFALDGPVPRPVQRPEVGPIRDVPEVGGWPHHDERRAA
jgi:hypothetical protein